MRFEVGALSDATARAVDDSPVSAIAVCMACCGTIVRVWLVQATAAGAAAAAADMLLGCHC